MNGNNLNGLYSWPAIIIALILFWPLGLYLLIKRASLDKQTAMASGKIVKGIGIGCYCMAVLGFLVCITDGFNGSDITLIIFFGAAGFALTYFAKKMKKDAEVVRQYLSIIVNGGERNIDTISATVGKQPDVVKNELKNLIDKGYLKNAYIKESTREIIFNDNKTQKPSMNIFSLNSNSTELQTRVVVCPCCGANNTISGASGECEYCGSPLK